MELSVKEWCSKNCPIRNPTYHLFGIVMHSGMTSCSGHYQAYIKVTTPTNIDMNNNSGQHHCDSDHLNTLDSSEQCETQTSSNALNGTSVRCNTFSTDDKSLDNEMSSPEDEKAKITCMSGISRYFQRSRKHSIKGTNEMLDGNENGAAGKKQRNHSTPTYSFAGNNRSIDKIQSFGYHGGKSNRSAIRQLNFQDNKQQGKECQNSAHVEETSNCGLHKLERETFQWIHFDDAEVTILEESDLTGLLCSAESSFTSPYLLFYKLAEP